MRRQTVNKNVLKAMTIGIAAIITTTSVPMNVYAAENDPVDPVGNSNPEGESSEEDLSVSEAIADCDAAEATADSASELIEDASDAVAEIQSSEIVSPDELDAIRNDLSEGSEFVTEADKAVEAAEDALSDVADIMDEQDSVYNVALDTANAVMNGLKDKDGNTVRVEDKLVEYDGAEQIATENSDLVIADAETANTSDDRDEAYKAYDNAGTELKAAKEALIVAATAYAEAKEAVDTASVEYDKAVEEKAKADAALQKAKDEIANANTNATAANERLKAAQSKVDALAGKVETLKENKKSLENLQADYYNFMVHYYRDNAIGSAVYDKDGKLDIEASAKKAVETGKVAGHPSVSENTYMLGRDLMKKIVSLELTANGVDPDTIRYGEQEKGLVNKKASEGDLVKDNKGKDRVTIADDQKYDIWMDYTTSGDDGRYHSVKVTYTTIVDGKEQEVTKYYNDIFKADKYENYSDSDANIADMEKGPIYIGEITKEGGKATAYSRDRDDFNFDSYSKILDAITALENIREYEEAQKAVEAAAGEVSKLKAEIESLGKVATDSSKIEELEGRLTKAKQVLEETTERKQALEEKVEEARRAYESIDLSRFVTAATVEDAEADYVAADDAEDDAEAGSTADAGAAAQSTVTAGAAVTAPGAGITAATVTAGDTGAAADGVSIVEIDENMVPMDNGDAQLIEKVMPKKIRAIKPVKIADNGVPLADITAEDRATMNWWWLLIVFLFGATGKKMYDEHVKRKEEKTLTGSDK